MKFSTRLFILALGFVCFFSCEQDINGQQVPGAEALTAEQIAATQEYTEYQKAMNDYSLAVLTSDHQAFEDRLQELHRQGKLILPLDAKQFSSINNAATYAAALNNLEREFKILDQKFDWRNLDHDFKTEILAVYQAANFDVLPNKILNTKGIDPH
jgi:hypothetical protein